MAATFKHRLKRVGRSVRRATRGAASTAPPPAHDPPGTHAERLAAAAQTLREGRGVLLDNGNREDEADLIVAAHRLTLPAMAMLIRECSGIVCLCLPGEVVDRLQLPPMAGPMGRNEGRYGTDFTVSIEARHGVSTGVSAADRLRTVRAAIAEDASPADLVSPGHVFPLRAARGGVLARRSHTEGALELCALAGLPPAAVLCELMNADGSMARGPQVAAFAHQHGLPRLTIEDLVQWRLQGGQPVA
ncbi:MAG: 3,4-dihydroxy-2-butanone-4-phosphate synthase [Rubrivivax sp.]|nr:3,4-dihydroxy-2-butanone-4-phosphate synthase [Rubrivivax sp.]